ACTGTQYLPATGAAKAMKAQGNDAVVYVESGGRHERGRVLRIVELGGARIAPFAVCHPEQRLRDQRSAAHANGVFDPQDCGELWRACDRSRWDFVRRNLHESAPADPGYPLRQRT